MKSKLEEKKLELAKQKYNIEPYTCNSNSEKFDRVEAFKTGFDAGITAYKEMLDVTEGFNRVEYFISENEILTKKLQQQEEKIADLEVLNNTGSVELEEAYNRIAEQAELIDDLIKAQIRNKQKITELESRLKEAESLLFNVLNSEVLKESPYYNYSEVILLARQYMEKVK